MLVVPIIAKQEAQGGSNKSQLRLISTSFCLHLAQGKVINELLEVQSWMTQIKGTRVQVRCGEPWWLPATDNLGSFRLEKTLESTESTINSTLPTPLLKIILESHIFPFKYLQG